MKFPSQRWDPLISTVVFSLFGIILVYFAWQDTKKENYEMNVRQRLEAVLIKWECGATRVEKLLTVRTDGGGLVVGAGHDVLQSEKLELGDKISLGQMSRLFTVDVNSALDGASGLIKNQQSHPEPVQVVVCAMVFQMGKRGVSKFKKMISAINNRDYDLASKEMLDSHWARQTPHRAQAMSLLIRQRGSWN